MQMGWEPLGVSSPEPCPSPLPWKSLINRLLRLAVLSGAVLLVFVVALLMMRRPSTTTALRLSEASKTQVYCNYEMLQGANYTWDVTDPRAATAYRRHRVGMKNSWYWPSRWWAELEGDVPPPRTYSVQPVLEGGGTCVLRRWRVHEARKCLAGKAITFVGESLTRYQYLNFVHFLEHGVWEDEVPHLVEEAAWPDGWPAFFQGSSDRLNGEICDCYRQGGWQQENRYYIRPQHQIRVSAHYWNPTSPSSQMKGHHIDAMWHVESEEGQTRDPDELFKVWDEGGAKRWKVEQTDACGPGQCSSNETFTEAAWSMDVYEMVEQFLPTLKPDVVIGLNAGFWLPLVPNFDLDRLQRAGQKAVSSKNGMVYFRTTTAPNRLLDPVDDSEAASYFRDQGDRVFDAYAITRGARELSMQDVMYDETLYWDVRHFRNTVYSEMNTVMLNMLCHK